MLILRALVQAIQEEEKSRPERHDSSFWPKLELPPLDRSEEDETLNNFSERPSLVNQDTGLTEATEDLENKQTSAELDMYGGYLLCHYFDYMGGTSTGGWVASFPYITT